MGLDGTEVRVFGSGHIYTAPVGTTPPTSVSEAVDTDDWFDHGYTTEDGARVTFSKETTDIFAWQSAEKIRTVANKAPKQVAFDLMQWNLNNIQLALGGGEVEEVATGEFEFTPPAASASDRRAFILEGVDGTYTYRFVFLNAENQAGVEFAFTRENAAALAIVMEILASGDDQAYTVQTDDPAWAGAS